MTILFKQRDGILFFSLIALGALTGCGANIAKTITQQAISPSGLSGQVRSGTQVVSGAQIYMYAAGTSGVSSAATSLLTTQVLSDGSGNFSLANNYTCEAGQQLYVVAVGGNTGTGVNPNAALMSTLGDCAAITSSTFLSLNEVTTVASVFSLASFMSSYADIGASASNEQGLASAFATVTKLVNTAKGSVTGPALPAGASLDSSKLNSLANIVAACMRSVGGTSGDGSICGQLFSLVTPAGTSAPTDTIGSVLSIAKSPANDTVALFNLTRVNPPFSPQLAVAPPDWAIAITYSLGGFNRPSSTSIDKQGNIWVANAGNSTVSVLAQSGQLVFDPLSGNSLNRPVAIAIDSSGTAWVANNGGSSVSIFQGNGEAGATPSATVGSGPTAVAVDPLGSIWVANSASSTLSKLSSAGTLLKTVSSQVNLPSGIAINTK